MHDYSPPLPWQKQQWQLLYRAHQAQRLPHALLLVGQSGLGKLFFAEQFAKTLLCEQPLNELACQHCRSCHWVAAKTHPDLRIIRPENNTKGIKIEQIRVIIEQLNHTALSNYKISIINPAEYLLTAASNALLKSLEEPSDRSLFMLVTEHEQQVLPTIRSRCQHIRFPSPEKSMACAWLSQQLPHLNASVIDKYYYLSAGAPLQALTYAKNVYEQFYAGLLTALVRLLNKEMDPIQCAAIYVKSDKRELLDTLLNLVVELLKCQLVQGYIALEATLVNLAKALSSDFLLNYYDLLIELRRHLTKIALNTQFMCEDLFSRWALQAYH